MKLEEYINLVKQHKGVAFGRTDQGRFIEGINKKVVTNPLGHLVQNLGYHFFKRPLIHTPANLNHQGICNGLAQAFYQKLRFNKDKEVAVKEFSEQLDNFDTALAKQSGSLQSFHHDLYNNVTSNDFHKSLGVELDQEETFYPYAKQEARKTLGQLLKKTEQKTEDKLQDEPERIFEQLSDYVTKHELDDFIRITLDFRSNDKSFFDPDDGHALFFSKVRNVDGTVLYVFYDPNAVPTLFFDESSFKQFLKTYLDKTSLEFKAGLKADYVQLNAERYTSDTHQFHKTMKILSEKITQKMYALPPDKDQENFVAQLIRLRKTCTYADEHGKLYTSPKKLVQTKDAAFNKSINELINKFSLNKRQYFSHQDLTEELIEKITNMKSYDEEFCQDLLNDLNHLHYSPTCVIPAQAGTHA